MYLRALLSLYGGGISGLRLTGTRKADLVGRWVSAGSVLRSEKSPPEDNGAGKPSGEAEEKTSLPHVDEPSKSPRRESLADLLGSMKVEVSSARKLEMRKRQSQEDTDNFESASRMFQTVREESLLDEEKPVSKELSDAASSVASAYPSQQKQVENDLFKQLRLHKQMAEEVRKKVNVIRNADLVGRRVSVGGVLRSEKSPPEDNGAGKPSGEAEEKTSLPHVDEPSKSPRRESLADLLGSMKVEVSSARKLEMRKRQSQEDTDNFESASRMFQTVREESLLDKEKPVSKELSDAASAVASAYPSQQKEVKNDLFKQLRLHKQMAEEVRKKANDISKVLSGMKVAKHGSKRDPNTSAEQRDYMRKVIKKSLYTGPRLNIFPAPSETPVGTAEMQLTLWDLELAKEISNVWERPPRNGFEEMIQWTKEGKLWTFPIDNEDGLDEEHKVEFHEHIYLEKYLEDFPKHGPIRHFMELVICGLSKNPYLTVQQKKDHIHWFHDYFQEKEDLLRECDVYVN